ncbi:aldehyde ferredoxin oxidoreductase family protein [Desulfosporosinus sp. BG]|uniref:aldehyde ferredoxin oxidoreductase family protein n=1 Tax=Desulfosporosinus sp. BG TaxID=1633135 RepID=UPI00083A7113|nr:aldehyde ferredoxin oxidoreductase family protein [Desulfosporosinus sp. BG]ODA40069.1 Tungsten-containing aldehyde:ferredoxin oxidoreductase [Desulfosporosinus sp. BG]
MGGYIGRILRINLTEGKTSSEPLNMELANKYLSGRGLAGKMFADEVSSDVKALDPENKLFIATGVLTGTDAPTSGRFMIVTKSPLNGRITPSNFGGSWGSQLKFAGYDMVILEGKAEYPVYITIRDDLVDIKDAAHVWGKDGFTATDILKQDFGDASVKVFTIGPAGENLSLMAVVLNDLSRAAGRSGVGAVMGSKNVKAIMVRGTGEVVTANSGEMEQVLSAALRKIKGNNVKSLARKTKRLTQREVCVQCPIACGRYSKGDEAESSDAGYKCVGEFASNLGICDQDAVQEVNDLCNKLGLDKIAVKETIATGIELAQLGYIRPEELDGTPLKYGNMRGTLEWIRKIAYHEGLGAKMALGSYLFTKSYGVSDLSKTLKKQKLPAQDLQGRTGPQLESRNRSGSHNRGYMITPERLGLSEKFNRTSLEGKTSWCKTFQDLTAVIDAVGLCLFTSSVLDLSDYTAIINAVIGCKYTDKELLACGERIWNNERLLNLRVGNIGAEDMIPKCLLNDPISDETSKGQVHKLAELLPQYYLERGWDEIGVPTIERLTCLGM